MDAAPVVPEIYSHLSELFQFSAIDTLEGKESWVGDGQGVGEEIPTFRSSMHLVTKDFSLFVKKVSRMANVLLW